MALPYRFPPVNLDADPCECRRPIRRFDVSLCGECLIWRDNFATHGGGGRRPGSEIDGFSAGARLRMLRTVHSIDWQLAGHGHFVTLTYPDHFYGQDKYLLTRHRSEFARRMTCRYGHDVAGLWRCEWERRKSGKHVGKMMPHNHCIFFREKHIFWDHVEDDWSASIAHRGYVDVRVDPMYTKKHVCRYVAKYASKPAPILGIELYPRTSTLGRKSGKFRRKLFPLAKRWEISLDMSTVVEAFRYSFAPPIPKEIEYGQKGFTLLGPKAVNCFRQIFERNLAGGELAS